MRKTSNLLPLCCSLSLLALLSAGAAASAAPPGSPPAITVTGTGEVSEKPNMARVNIGVVTQLASASESLQSNSEAVDKVFATLRKFKIAEDDIQTSDFNIGPEYDYSRSGQPPRLIGYRVTNQVRVAVRRIDDLGKLLDAVVTAGSNQINEVGFEIDEVESFADTARKLAMADAHRKASLYANEAGVKLGTVLRIEEMSGPAPVLQGAVTMAAEMRAVPMAPGRQIIRQVVRVTYAIQTAP